MDTIQAKYASQTASSKKLDEHFGGKDFKAKMSFILFFNIKNIKI